MRSRGSEGKRSVRWCGAARATALGGVALAGSGGAMSSSGAALGKEPGPGPRWQWVCPIVVLS